MKKQVIYLFYSDCRPPVFFLIQKRQTHCARWVNIGVENWGIKFTYKKWKLYKTLKLINIAALKYHADWHLLAIKLPSVPFNQEQP